MTTIHVTERSTFKQCKRKWQYRHQFHLAQLTTLPNKFWFGILIHKCMAEYYKNNAPLLDTFINKFDADIHTFNWEGKAEEAAYEYYNLGVEMLRGYMKYSEENDKNWEIVAVEEPLTIPISTEFSLTGTPDLLIRENGKLFIVDHKTYARLVNIEDLAVDDQMTAYCYMVWKLYDEKPGILYNQLLKKIPAEPQVLKNGGLSRDKNIVTTVEKYMAAIEENNLDWTDYAEVLGRIRENYHFYKRETSERTLNELKIFGDNLQLELLDYEAPVIYPNITRNCRTDCMYFELCKCENTGGPTKNMMDYLFKVEAVQFGTNMEEKLDEEA